MTKELLLAKTKEHLVAKAMKRFSFFLLFSLSLFFIFIFSFTSSVYLLFGPKSSSSPYEVLFPLPTFPSLPHTTHRLFGFTSFPTRWPQSCALSHYHVALTRATCFWEDRSDTSRRSVHPAEEDLITKACSSLHPFEHWIMLTSPSPLWAALFEIFYFFYPHGKQIA